MEILSFILTTVVIIIFSISMLAVKENDYTIFNIHESSAKQGHNIQYYEGVNKWETCFRENEDKNNWTRGLSEQQAAIGYTLTGNMDKYAEMDLKSESPSKINTELIGEVKAQEMWGRWFATVKNSCSYTFKLPSVLSI